VTENKTFMWWTGGAGQRYKLTGKCK